MMNPLALAQANTTAPALNRGLAVLAALDGHSPLSLESLCSKLHLPKASVFRLLGTLQEIGMVRKTPEKTYEALCVLRPLANASSLFRERVENRMAGLCKNTGCTVEWYEPTADGMKLVEQVNPEVELRVQAKPGFLRKWKGEFDAVARLGYAFDPQAPLLESLQTYVSNGVLKNISPKSARALLNEARQSHCAADLHYNTNGVRRFAAAALENGQFRGVLALAEAVHFSRPVSTDLYLGKLRNSLETI